MSNSKYSLQQMMRWYGPKDPVSLSHIAQAGCTGVVSALHSIPIGEPWSQDAISSYKKEITSFGLEWTVVESLPVHEDIKTRSGKCNIYIDNYKSSLKNLAACGIKVVTYNFMPVLDWLRTDVTYKLSNRSEALRFDLDACAIVDLFLLKRPGAKLDYSKERVHELKEKYDTMGEDARQALFKNILMGLPGDATPFTPAQVLKMISKYDNIDRNQLKDNLIHFLTCITPIAEQVGINLAVHPDDPPFPVFGLPRILSTEKDVEEIFSKVPSIPNGLCFCTGSFGARKDNDLLAMIEKWGSRMYFLHLRNTSIDDSGNFMEASHLEGDTDMYAIMEKIVILMQKEKRRIPMRPDHGHKMLDDLQKKTYPGYSAIGRLKGLAELRGLEYGLLRQIT